MEVLHDWTDEACVAILAAVPRAGFDDSILLVVEGLIPEGDAHPRSCTLDVVTLTPTGGRERTARELGARFDKAGFRLAEVIDTARPVSVIEAHPV
jgi:hypothetical protein